ncbi:EamA family transporter [Massilia dura]|uniref:EamA family transporter n=1 Tax=Pseudoduganella dura TaxID=321982 RepID=A0A6I3XM85_9BURK|nr:DMT family transporter [Pseudoduganella dura]MUI12815.1 EamA family transporter [Pseudoduganella dura]GGX93035.1 multidrug DMT transporter permease [Pseudoduganella dura]
MVKDHRRGIAAGIAAGALWGLIFLAPELAPGFAPMQLSAGRYLAYGIIAAVLVAPSWNALRQRLGRAEWRALVWLGLAGNIVYYVLLAAAVQSGGVAMASLVIGLAPIAVTLAGSRDRHAVPLRRLAPSLALSAAGLACIGWDALSAPGTGSLPGLLCALGALVSWTLYVVGNSRVLARITTVSAREWSLLTGVVTGIEALVLAVPAFLLADGMHDSAAWWKFVGIVGAVAMLCSVLGNALWNHASRALPLALAGQMIVFETLFGLLYGFLWEGRWPTMSESAAMVLLTGGVVCCAAAHAPGKPGRGAMLLKVAP